METIERTVHCSKQVELMAISLSQLPIYYSCTHARIFKQLVEFHLLSISILFHALALSGFYFQCGL